MGKYYIISNMLFFSFLKILQYILPYQFYYIRKCTIYFVFLNRVEMCFLHRFVYLSVYGLPQINIFELSRDSYMFLNFIITHSPLLKMQSVVNIVRLHGNENEFRYIMTNGKNNLDDILIRLQYIKHKKIDMHY